MVCAAPTETEQADYCTSHNVALRAMREAYQTWSKAYESIRLEQFLAKLSELPESGEWVKELSGYLTKNPNRWTG